LSTLPFLPPPRTPQSPLFPYTTLFRSLRVRSLGGLRRVPLRHGARRQLHSARAISARDNHRRRGVVPHRRLAGSLDVRAVRRRRDRKSTRLNSSHDQISYAVFCLKKKK